MNILRRIVDKIGEELSVIPQHIGELDEFLDDALTGRLGSNAGLVGEDVSETSNISITDGVPYDEEHWVEIGFPEGQILPYCDGDLELCAELSEIFHLGGLFPVTDNEQLERVTSRLTEHSGYGAFGAIINGNPLEELADTLNEDWEIGTDINDALS